MPPLSINVKKMPNQACDICRKRKVKCDRQLPCSRCRRLHQPCTYTDVLRKKGPRFLHLYPMLRQGLPWSPRGATSSSASASSGFGVASIYTAGSGSGSETPELDMPMLDSDQMAAPCVYPSTTTAFQPEEANSFSHIMEETLVLYSDTLYPHLPIFDLRHEIQRLRLQHSHPHLPRIQHDRPHHAFLLAVRAATYAHFQSPSLREETSGGGGRGDLLTPALLARSTYDIISPGTDSSATTTSSTDINSLLSSFFLFLTYFSLNRTKHAWFYLRECIALLLSARLHREDDYGGFSPREAEYRRRVFWGVFVLERTFCLLHNKPITLQPWINTLEVPSIFDEDGVLPGFIRTVNLFRGVTVDLEGCWTTNGFAIPIHLDISDIPPAPPPLRSIGGDGPGPGPDMTEPNHGEIGSVQAQRLDDGITRAWLLAKTWRLRVPSRSADSDSDPGSGSGSEFVLRSGTGTAQWRLDRPLRLARAVLDALAGSVDVLAGAGIGAWGRILDQKLYDVCNCLCDVVPIMQSLDPGETDLVVRGLLEVLSKGLGFRDSYSLLTGRLEGVVLL